MVEVLRELAEYPAAVHYWKVHWMTEIILQLCENEEFIPLVPPECIKENVLARIKTAQSQSIVVLFLKGTPKEPFDG